MSRRRKALIAVAFSYAQSVLGILAGLFITRLLVRALGADLYGTWLATGGLLGYAAFADLGIFSVMPWLIAEAEGEKDPARTSGLISHGLLAGAGVGIIYAGAALGVWLLLPRMAHLDVKDLERLRGPIAVIVLTTAVGYPIRVFSALRSGLQDFKFLGLLGLINTVLNAGLSYGLLRAGLGLYALAIASAVPPTLTSVCSLVRTFQCDRPLLRALPRPTWRLMRPILTSGAGGLLGSLGWQMASATDAIVIAYLGYRHLVPSFVITSRVGLTLMQFAWTLPDSAFIGLANLAAEGNRSRTVSVVQTLIRLHLIPVGVIACGTLAANAVFVRLWVGADLFGGTRLNALLTLNVVVLSIVHALVTTAAALGTRVGTGALALANGVVHILLALILGHWFALSGVAAATALSATLTSIPVGARLLATRTGISAKAILGSLILPWGGRTLPCALVATAVGWALSHSRLAATGLTGTLLMASGATAIIVVVYLWGVKDMMKALPFGPRLTRILSAVGLV